jgi:predicted regulator of Ras-like GTPase activity (Roadblock/LC7/MglB family)
MQPSLLLKMLLGGTRMGELAHIRNVLDEIKGLEHVSDVSLVSRGGLYIMGDSPKGSHPETFSAMNAIMIGAAETTSAELKDGLRYMMIKLMEKDLILVGAGTRYMLAIVTDGSGDNDNIAKSATQIIGRVDLNI